MGMLLVARLAAWLSAVTLFAAAELELVIIHTNDMHSRLDQITGGGGTCPGPEAKCYGGFARIKAAAQQIRDSNPNVLFLNAGDTFQGSPYYTIYKWEIIAKFVDMLGIDVMSLGNHEFDDGVSGLAPYLATVRTPSVACNIDYTLEPTLNGTNLYPWYNLTVDGTQIAVVGYITPDTVFLSQTGNVRFRDEVESIRAAAKEAREAGAKLVFAVGHSGYSMDTKIANEVEEIDLVVGGHTNTFLYTGDPPDREVPVSVYPHIEVQESGKKVPVVQAFAWTKYLGVLQLKFNDNYELESYSGNPILMDSSKPKDPSVEEELSKWKKDLEESTKKVIGQTTVDLIGECRMKECVLGDLIADGMYDYGEKLTKGLKWPKVPIVITNSGGVRASIYLNATGGNVTWGDVLTVMPFQNKLRLVKAKGSVVKEVFEHSVSRYDPSGVNQIGGFLVISGAKVLYDVSKDPGKRVKSLSLLCGECPDRRYEKVHHNEEYYLLMPEFLSEGGDGYYMLKNQTEHIFTSEDSDVQIVADYIRSHSPVSPEIDGRITVITEQSTSGASKPKSILSNLAPFLKVPVDIRLS